MPTRAAPHKVSRILDANLNRLKEGLRVCEEIARFMLNSRSLTVHFKKVRHEVDGAVSRLPLGLRGLLSERESARDVGRRLHGRELKRESVSDIFFANIQRVKESARVLEEFSKLFDKQSALLFKNVRYEVYGLEKSAGPRVRLLR